MMNNSQNSKVIIGVVSILFVLVAGFATFRYYKNSQAPKKMQEQSMHAPVRTDYKGILPPLFPKDVSVRKEDSLSQSYAKDYGTLKQSSIVLFSKEGILSNFDFYTSSLSKDGYTISTSTKNELRSFLVADKTGSHVEIIFVDRIKNTASSTLSGRNEIKTDIVINAFDRKF